MQEDIICAVAAQLSGKAQDDPLLCTVCRAAAQYLEERLRPGIDRTMCGDAFLYGAAALAADTLERGGVTAFSAGSVSVTMDGGRGQPVCRLLAPWLRDDGFCFRGVRG